MQQWSCGPWNSTVTNLLINEMMIFVCQFHQDCVALVFKGKWITRPAWNM